LSNIRFLARDLSDFNRTAEPESFDVIATFDAVHDQAKPPQVLQGNYGGLKTDGVYVMQDISGSVHVPSTRSTEA
jgi:hypothetical protein